MVIFFLKSKMLKYFNFIGMVLFCIVIIKCMCFFKIFKNDNYVFKKNEVFIYYNYVLCFCRRLNLECFNKNFDVLINIICKVFIL